jgi:hypothetical protein
LKNAKPVKKLDGSAFFLYGSCGWFSGICLEVQMDVINYAHPDTKSKFSIDNSFPKGLF